MTLVMYHPIRNDIRIYLLGYRMADKVNINLDGMLPFSDLEMALNHGGEVVGVF